MPSLKEGFELENLYETIIECVQGGQFDESLFKLASVVKDRQWKVSRQIGVGDRIRVVGNMSPKYIVGATGTVVGKHRDRIEADIDPEFVKGRKFEGGGPLGFPYGNVVKLESVEVFGKRHEIAKHLDIPIEDVDLSES